MPRRIFLFLLALNLGLAAWGWSRDRYLDAPPPLPKAAEEIRLPSELNSTAAPTAARGAQSRSDAASTGVRR